MPYKYKGQEVTEAQIINAANQSNLSIEEYAQKVGIEVTEEAGKTQPPVPGAPADATAAPDMDLQQEDFLSELQSQTKEDKKQLVQSAFRAITPLNTYANLIGATDFTRSIASFAARTGAGVVDAVERTILPLAEATYNPTKLASFLAAEPEQRNEIIKEAGQGVNLEPVYELAKYIDSAKPTYTDEEGNQLRPTDLIQRGEYKKATEVALSELASAAPSLAISYALPGVGSAVLGISTYGQELENEIKERPDEVAGKLYSASALKGLAEFGFEYLGGKVFRTLSGFKNANAPAETIKEFAENYLKQTLKAFGGNFLTEGSTEFLTTIAQEYSDQFVFGDEKDVKEVTKQAFNDFLIGGLLGGPVAAGGKTISIKQTKANKKEVYMHAAPITEQEKILKAKARVAETKADYNNAPDPLKQQYKEYRDQAETNLNELETKLENKFDGLSKKELLKYAKNMQTIATQKRIASSNINKDTKQRAAEKAKQAYKDNEAIIGDINYYNATVENAIQNQINTAQELASNLGRVKGINKKDLDVETITSQRAKQLGLKENASGMYLQEQDGKNKIYINLDIASDVGDTNVLGHELLHYVISRQFKTDDASMKPLVDSFKTYLQESGEEGARILQRIEQRLENAYAGKAPLEEYLNVFSDLVKNEGIELNESIADKLKSGFNTVFQGLGLTSAKLNTGKQVFDFIKNYTKNVNSKNKFLQKAAVNVKINSDKLIKSVGQEAEKYSLSENDNQQLSNLFRENPNKLLRNEKANDVIRRVAKRVTQKYYDPIPSDAKRNVTREEYEDSAVTELSMISLEWNPDKQDFGKFLANRGFLRLSNLAPRLGIESTEEYGGVGIMTDVEVSKEAQAATEETAPAEFTKKMQEANKKINLSEGLDTSIEVDGKSYEAHVKDALSKTVARAVKKINEDISANRTVTPFVESIKADMAQDLRKITKKFINQIGYEKFLIEHRELILNNFTTTYLAKHPLFRKGIEKSIGGKMITDNQGNKLFEPNFVLPKQTSPNKYEWVDEKGNKAKIDRDNAGVRGLTSGPEIMRRNKNIGEIITENEFVDYHFQDGAQRTKKKQNPEDALAMQIASEISFDYLKEDFLNEQEIFGKAQEYGEVLGIAIPDTQAQELAKDFDRGTIKYSISEKDMGWFIGKSAENSDTDFLTSEINKKFAKDPITKEALLNFANEGPLWLAKLIQVKKELNLGIAYEEAINKILSAAVSTMKAKNITIELQGRFDASAVDLVITHKSDPNNPIKIEIKLNQDAQMSSFTIKDIIDFEASVDNLPANVEYAVAKSLEGKDKVIKKYNEAATKKAKELGFDVIQPGQKGNNTLFVKTHKDVFNSLKGDGFDGIAQKDLNIKVELTDTSVVELLYKSKGVDYIQIGGKGLFFMNNSGKPNVFNAPLLSEAVENVTINIRPDRKTSKGVSYFSYRAFPKFSGVKQSTVSLDNTSTIKKTLEKLNADKESPVIKQSISEKDVTRVNNMISETGRVTKNEISEVTATRMAKNKGKFKFYVPPSADDFVGLMYYMVRKGKIGEEDLEFIREKLIKPFGDAQAAFDSYKIQTLNDFRNFKKLIRKVPSAKLSAKNDLGFTNEEAVRVYLWSKKGVDIPGISKAEVQNLVELVESNSQLLGFASNISNLFAADGYPDPQENWFGASMTIDILEHINETSRKEFFAEFTENAETLFGKLNNKGEISGPIANKLRAAYGDNYVEALSDVLYRMKNGRSREFGKNRLVNQLNNWINNSVGAVMFFNTRSALLQQVSMVNFINLSDNNPIKFAEAISNPKQYWADYLYLLNSDYLVSRRSGLKIDINQDEIAKAAESGRNPIQGVISAVLKKGFLLTSWGDSHAIATGGAAFYRNRINTYLRDGLTKEEAEKKAFEDFREISEESQQSSRPDRISQQQASTLGRAILAWANTPMQYARITKKAGLDLINRRGDWKTNVSKIIYYGTLQNLLFSYLQQGLFAMLFDGEDDEEKDLERWEFTFNSMADGFLRGLGYGGAIVSVAKNMVIEAIEQEKGRKNFDNVVWEALKISPPLGSKISKAVSATTNIPLDRIVRKMDNITYPIRHDVEFWQAAALYLGWGQWELGLQETKKQEKQNPKMKIINGKYYKIKTQ